MSVFVSYWSVRSIFPTNSRCPAKSTPAFLLPLDLEGLATHRALQRLVPIQADLLSVVGDLTLAVVALTVGCGPDKVMVSRLVPHAVRLGEVGDRPAYVLRSAPGFSPTSPEPDHIVAVGDGPRFVTPEWVAARW